jgi:hypothetical protein
MKTSVFLLLVLFFGGLRVDGQTTTFPSPGPQNCTSTNTQLAPVMAPDGVTIKPFLRLDASCLDANLATFSINSPASFRRPTFCYNNGYFPSTSGYPLAIARNSTANSGNCDFGRSNVVADFSTATIRPKGLTFTVNDVDNPYDSIEVRIYNAGTLVPYTFTFGDPNTATSFAWSGNTSGSGTVVQFNGGANGVWGESNGWSFLSGTQNQSNAQGTIYFVADPTVSVDSVVVTHIIRNNRPDINAAISIGDFKWTANQVLPVAFGEIDAIWSVGKLTVNWQTLSETNNDHFEVQASADGQHFKTIGAVQSKAEGGTSDQVITYRFSNANEVHYAAVAFSLVAFCLLLFMCARKNKWVLGCGIVLMVAIAGASCSKSSETVNPGEKDLYIRILQVDKDGKQTNSKIIKAINP